MAYTEGMPVSDLQTEHHASYFSCLEEWSDEIREAGEHKACWYHKYKDRGLRVKLFIDDDGQVAGMIQYLPVEESFIEGRGLYFILCIWVHGYKEGVGERQGRGIGKALLQAAEQDAREQGATGMAAWGLWLPFWMKASWFRRHGYKKAERNGISLLVWKPFSDEAVAPHWIKPKKKVTTTAGMVTVTAFINGWCPAQNMVYERTKRACAEFDDRVLFTTIDTSDRAVFDEWGIVDGIFVDGKRLSFGPPLSYEKIRKVIARRVKRLPHRG